jgi:hypothetical protein
MSRANRVRPSPQKVIKKENPPGVPDGSIKECSPRARHANAELSASLRTVAQARATVAAVLAAHRRLNDLSVEGKAWEAARGEHAALTAHYRSGFAILSAAHVAPDEFESLSGVDVGALETALEALGWFIASPAARARIRNGAMYSLTPEGLAAYE